MQNENDDIERLFRRAADSYPLKTSGSDWEKVATQLDKEETSDKAFIPGKNTSPLLILLLLGILAIGVGYFLNNEGQNKIAGKNNVVPVNGKSGVVSNKPVKSDPATDQNLAAGSDNKINGSFLLHPNNVGENDLMSFDKNNGKANKIYSKRIRVKSASSLRSQIISSQVMNDQNTGIKKDELQIEKELKTNVDSSPKKEIENLTTTITDNAKNVELSTNEHNVVKHSSNEQAVKKVSKIKNKQKQQYFYASVILGPDISNIKQQNYAGTGYSAGFILGYTKNKFSLETGLLWDKKYYNTDAKYFNPKNKDSFYWYGSLVALDGVCNMFEVPVNISFKINNNTRNIFLFKTGLTSYFMKKEYYDYTYKSYGNIYSANKLYKNSATNLFSVLNVVLKYDHSLNRSLSFGIEPYLKIPVGNIGTGRMPISSTGMYIVLTKKLF